MQLIAAPLFWLSETSSGLTFSACHFYLIELGILLQVDKNDVALAYLDSVFEQLYSGTSGPLFKFSGLNTKVYIHKTIFDTLTLKTDDGQGFYISGQVTNMTFY